MGQRCRWGGADARAQGPDLTAHRALSSRQHWRNGTTGTGLPARGAQACEASGRRSDQSGRRRADRLERGAARWGCGHPRAGVRDDDRRLARPGRRHVDLGAARLRRRGGTRSGTPLRADIGGRPCRRHDAPQRGARSACSGRGRDRIGMRRIRSISSSSAEAELLEHDRHVARYSAALLQNGE